MDLPELRNKIDDIDDQIQQLFEQRMRIVQEVAAYKKANHLPVLHQDRENQIISRVMEQAEPAYSNSAKVLFTNIMDISKCSQKQLLQSQNFFGADFAVPFSPQTAKKVVCQGVLGAYSHLAARKLFSEDKLSFVTHFEDVFAAVMSGDADYGILPIENSNAGSVVEVYELLKKYDIYIVKRIKLKVEHCLAAQPGTTLAEIQGVYSHEQGIHQCSSFLQKHNLNAYSYSNTSAAAAFVAQSAFEKQFAAICSRLSAEQNGLEILSDRISNIDENYTRFICISRTPQHSPDDNIISISFTLPHTVGSLYRTLTKIFVYDINMEKIESKPIGNKNFDVMFYLDFNGNYSNPKILTLLHDLSSDSLQFKYLGNYTEII